MRPEPSSMSIGSSESSNTRTFSSMASLRFEMSDTHRIGCTQAFISLKTRDLSRSLGGPRLLEKAREGLSLWSVSCVCTVECDDVVVGARDGQVLDTDQTRTHAIALRPHMH